MFGIEFSSLTGNPYVLPDKNPYTFHGRYDWVDPGNMGEFLINTGIPTSVQILVFIYTTSPDGVGFGTLNVGYRNSGGIWHLVFNTNGGGNLPYGTRNTSAYVFTDKILHTSNGGSTYGLEIFDENGDLVLDSSRKPLKVTPYVAAKRFSGSEIVAVPKKAAPLLTILECYDPTGSIQTYITYNIGYSSANGSASYLSVLRNFISSGKIFGGSGRTHGSYPSTVLCIHIEDYD